MEFENIYDSLNLQELERKLEDFAIGSEISFIDMVKEIYEGNGKGILINLWENCKNVLFLEVNDVKDIFITVVIVILISAIFSTFQKYRIIRSKRPVC